MTGPAGRHFRVLIADDEPRIVEAMARLLRLEGYEVEGAPDGEAALSSLARGGFDALLLDLDMPRRDGLSTLRALRERGDAIPVLIVSGHGTVARAVEAVKLGAHDFVEKPVDDERLLLSLRRALEYRRLAEEVEVLREDQGVRGIVAGRALREVLSQAERAAASGASILVTGETGVGKEVVAHLVHRASQRRDGPFVRVNCAALPESLAESELFGHVRGAFTGAARDRKGRFQLAHGGTLFLDEVGELSPAVQAKLLRAVAEGEFEPVGSDRTLRADVRIVAATNRDLPRAVAEGKFREDLYYRLAVVVLEIPPIRARRDEIPLFVESFLAELRKRLGRPGLRFSPEALARLASYDWPGNVREIRNVVERLAVLSPTDEIGLAEIARSLPSGAAPSSPVAYQTPAPLADALAQEEAKRLREALREAGGNVSAAARALGLERSHFYKKCRRHGIDPRGG